MDVIQKITSAIEPSLADMGYGLVQVKIGEIGRRKTLTVMAERRDEKPMGMEDCTNISRHVGALLDVEDPISSAYDLEVCSPGLDRPLTRLADYSRYAGQEAKVETYAPLDGRKRFRGELLGAEAENIKMRVDGGDVTIAFANIRNAKLMVSETLLKRNKK